MDFKIHSISEYKLSNEKDETGKPQYYISGYVCHYGVRNENLEYDFPGCFDEHIKQVKNNNQSIPLVITHDNGAQETIGKFLLNEFQSHKEGLYGKAKVTLTPYIQNEIIPKLQDGIYPCFSTDGWATVGGWNYEKEQYEVERGILNFVALVSQGADLKAAAELQELKNHFKNEKFKKAKIFPFFNI